MNLRSWLFSLIICTKCEIIKRIKNLYVQEIMKKPLKCCYMFGFFRRIIKTEIKKNERRKHFVVFLT